MSKFGNSCKKPICYKFLVQFCIENANSGHFDKEISLTTDIIFTKIDLANGYILKLWTAHPYPKFGRESSSPPSVEITDCRNVKFAPSGKHGSKLQELMEMFCFCQTAISVQLLYCGFIVSVRPNLMFRKSESALPCLKL